MDLILMGTIVLIAILIVLNYRKSRDREMLTAAIAERGGTAVRLQRVRKGHPFPDTGRGWWVWQVEWRDQSGDRRSYALTTREGVKEWRD